MYPAQSMRSARAPFQNTADVSSASCTAEAQVAAIVRKARRTIQEAAGAENLDMVPTAPISADRTTRRATSDRMVASMWDAGDEADARIGPVRVASGPS